jgi:hypothetical protein
MFWEKRKALASAGFKNRDHPACSVVDVLTMLPWLWKKGGER